VAGVVLAASDVGCIAEEIGNGDAERRSVSPWIAARFDEAIACRAGQAWAFTGSSGEP
jgi:hypothetical protein